MNTRSISSEAIVLSSKTFSEADKIITVYSNNYGKLSLVAKGARRPRSRKRGALEVFSILKFFAHKGNGMPILTEAETVDNLAEVRGNLKKVSVAYFYTEVVSRATRDEEPHTEVYNLLKKYMLELKNPNPLKDTRKSFSIKLMEILGFIPEGQFVPNADEMLESIIERKLGSVRVGKRLQA